MARKNETYESMIKRVEEIVGLVEKDGVTLDDSMKMYEEGIKLCNKLYKILNEAEGKIKILTNDEEKDFLEIKE